jgi:hypothetical protein
MGFKKAADGITKKGKTEGKNLGDSGPTAPNPRGGKKSSGVTSEAMMKVGRNMARVANQMKG